MTEGVSLKSRNIEITYPKTRGKVGHVLEGVFSFPTVSNVILDVLRDFCQEDIDLEITPVTIKRKSPFEYFFINTLHKVDAIDDQQSELVELVPNTKVYNRIDRLILDPQQIGDRSMFRVHGHRIWIFITESLKQALEALEELDLYPLMKPSNGACLVELRDEIGGIDLFSASFGACYYGKHGFVNNPNF